MERSQSFEGRSPEVTLRDAVRLAALGRTAKLLRQSLSLILFWPAPRMNSLDSISSGIVRCLAVEGNGPEVTRLKRMGICAGRRLQIIHPGDPMILLVAGTRVGLSRQLARCVSVETVVTVIDALPEASDRIEGGPA